MENVVLHHEQFGKSSASAENNFGKIGVYTTSTPLSSLVNDSGYSTEERSVETNTPFELVRRKDEQFYTFTPGLTPNTTNESQNGRPTFDSDSGLPLPKFSLRSFDIDDIPKFNIHLDRSPMRAETPLFLRLVPRSCGQNIGTDKIDFLKEFRNSNLYPVLSTIFEYLDDKDFSAAQNVSKVWREVINSYGLKNRIPPIKSPVNPPKKSKPFDENDRVRCPLESIQHIFQNVSISDAYSQSNISQSSVPSSALHEKYLDAAKKLIPCEFLRPCPRCSSPARITPIENHGHCTGLMCLYDFCSNCTTDFHGSAPCPVRNVVNGKISMKKCKVGSEKSKRNLRRL